MVEKIYILMKEILQKDRMPASLFLVDRKLNVICFLENEYDLTYFHCELILYQKYDLTNKILIINLEPCISCGFILLQTKLKAIFFGTYNNESGCFGGKINLKSYNKNNIIIFGPILEKRNTKKIKDFFKTLRYIKN